MGGRAKKGDQSGARGDGARAEGQGILKANASAISKTPTQAFAWAGEIVFGFERRSRSEPTA
jgi:hypothetical protein